MPFDLAVSFLYHESQKQFVVLWYFIIIYLLHCPVFSLGSGHIWEKTEPDRSEMSARLGSRFPVTRVTLGMLYPYKEVFAVLLTFAHFTDDFGIDPELVWTPWRWPAPVFPKKPFSFTALHQHTLLPLTELALAVFRFSVMDFGTHECDWKIGTHVVFLCRVEITFTTLC